MSTPSLRSRARGCLLGGALGDSLGAEIEFWTHRQIIERYGLDGPDDLEVAYGVQGAITDDTQMTLWTADGCLRAYLRGASRGIVSIPSVVTQSYLQWLQNAGRRPATRRRCTRLALQPLRPPHSTCARAHVPARPRGRRDEPYASPSADERLERMRRRHADGSRRAPLRYAGEGLLRRAAIWLESRTDTRQASSPPERSPPRSLHLRDGADLEVALDHAREAASALEGGQETAEALDRALEAATSDLSDADAVHSLGTVTPDRGPGWVAEEALAVAALCARRYPTDPRRALRMAVTHTGDSDSTGAICGNLLGASLGLEALPSDWRDAAELRDVIMQVADDLYDARTVEVDWHSGLEDVDWISRYR